MSNVLYYGDNLPVLRKWVADESVDLIYLDPPFNSKRMYNQIFKGTNEPDRIFKDYWEWDDAAEAAFREVVGAGSTAPRALVSLMEAMRRVLDRDKEMLAYLSMMTVRLLELHRVLKPNGSLYLHCDPTASHYLKACLDAIFGSDRFQNEIVWKRTSGHSDSGRYGSVHDIILFYAKGDARTWNDEFMPYDPAYVEQYYRYQDASGRRFMSDNLSAAGLSGGGYEYEWKGVTRVWRVPLKTMERLDAEGHVFYTRNGIPRRKRYLDEAKGLPVQDVWNDIEAIRSWHKEKLGYPTQKPVALLERIVRVSSNPGEVVLDPFCGCGTTIEACEKLGRRWLGIDVAPQVVDIVKQRMAALGVDDLEVVGWPRNLDGAERLAREDKIGFQRWVVHMIRGRLPDGRQYRGGADGGVDGELLFDDNGRKLRAIISVKGGGVGSNDIRVLRDVVQETRSEMGVFVTMQEPTPKMRELARDAGFVTDSRGREYRRIQILTAQEIIDGKRPDLPGQNVTPESTRPGPRKGETLALPFGKSGTKPTRPSPAPTKRTKRR